MFRLRRFFLPCCFSRAGGVPMTGACLDDSGTAELDGGDVPSPAGRLIVGATLFRTPLRRVRRKECSDGTQLFHGQ
jgi:hypothetical protein